MHRNVEFDPELENDVNAITKAMVKEAKNVQRIPPPKETGTPRDIPRGTETPKDTVPASTKKSPVCLFPKCKKQGIRHFVQGYPESTPEKKTEFFAKHHEEIKKRRNTIAGTPDVKRVEDSSDKKNEESSTVFACTYAGRTRDFVMTDIGSDVSLMDEKLLTRIFQEGGDVSIQKMPNRKTFYVAVSTSQDAKPISVTCAKKATMTVELYVRHGKTLIAKRAMDGYRPRMCGITPE